MKDAATPKQETHANSSDISTSEVPTQLEMEANARPLDTHRNRIIERALKSMSDPAGFGRS